MTVIALTCSAVSPTAAVARNVCPSSDRQEHGRGRAVEQRLGTLDDALKQLVQIESGRDLAAHIRQLRHLRRSALGFAVQLCVLDGRSDVGREGRQEPRIGITETAFLGEALDADRADCVVTYQDRDAKVGAGVRSRKFHRLFRRIGRRG